MAFLEGGVEVLTLRSGVETTVRVELVNPKNLGIDYTLDWEDDSLFVARPRVTVNQPTVAEFRFILNTRAEQRNVVLGLRMSIPSTGKTYPTSTFEVLCDSPPSAVGNLVAGNDVYQRAIAAFTLSEAPTDADITNLQVDWRDVTQPSQPGPWQSQVLAADAGSLTTPVDPDLLQEVVASKKRYFSPPGITAGLAYQFSVVVIDRNGSRSEARSTSTSAVTKTLRYDANGGSGTLPDDGVVTFGTSVVVDPEKRGFSLTPPSGRVFGGWNTDPQGTGETFSPNDYLVLEEDLVLYALWLEPTNGLVITFAPTTFQNLTLSPSSVTVTSGTEVTVTPSFGAGTTTDWQWYLDGTLVGTDPVFSGIPAVGFHTLIVIVMIDNVLYSGTLTLTVESK